MQWLPGPSPRMRGPGDEAILESFATMKKTGIPSYILPTTIYHSPPLNINSELTSSAMWLTSMQAEQELELFGFAAGSDCYHATSTVLNSIPFSCHSALNQLLTASGAPPLLIHQLRLDHLDPELCHIYCSYPLRQGGEDCHQLHLLHEILNSACLTNVNGTM